MFVLHWDKAKCRGVLIFRMSTFRSSTLVIFHQFSLMMCIIVSLCRDRKTIDIENRANYIALRRRWEVMDRTITFPEDDLAAEEPWYMEFSEDEDADSNSAPSSDDLPPSASSVVTGRREEGGLNYSSRVGSGGNLTASRDSGNFTEASLETSSEISCGSSVADTCSSCGGRGKEVAAPSEGGSGWGLHVSAASSNGGCGLSPGGTRRCERCRKGGSVGAQTGSEGVASAADCGCGWRKRRRSTNGILDVEGRALLEILEFPSRVRVSI